jgi:divalent metal cation (Fe/Co/Zn/Cd) transporter
MTTPHPSPDAAAGNAEPCGCAASTPSAGTAFPAGSDQWQRAAGRARRLSWLSLAYMGLEGAVAITAAVIAGSVALLGFGLDSLIEGLASIIIIWRLTAGRTLSETAEVRAQKAVAVSFFLLAPYIAVDALSTLAAANHAATSWIGIGLAASSLIAMPVLGRMKRRLGRQLDSPATAGEGTQNLLCAYLAAGVLVGLLANTLFGKWWVDPVVALGIAALAVREGREAWRGEDCGC